MQPVGQHFGGVFTRHGAGKTQPAFAEDALVRIGAQEALQALLQIVGGDKLIIPFC